MIVGRSGKNLKSCASKCKNCFWTYTLAGSAGRFAHSVRPICPKQRLRRPRRKQKLLAVKERAALLRFVLHHPEPFSTLVGMTSRLIRRTRSRSRIATAAAAAAARPGGMRIGLWVSRLESRMRRILQELHGPDCSCLVISGAATIASSVRYIGCRLEEGKPTGALPDDSLTAHFGGENEQCGFSRILFIYTVVVIKYSFVQSFS